MSNFLFPETYIDLLFIQFGTVDLYLAYVQTVPTKNLTLIDLFLFLLSAIFIFPVIAVFYFSFK